MTVPTKFATLFTLSLLSCCLLRTPEAIHAKEIWVDQSSDSRRHLGTESSPFQTLDAALKMCEPGDDIVVQGGAYYEEVRLPPGHANNPTTLRSVPGRTTKISGMTRLAKWSKVAEELYRTTLTSPPDALYRGQVELPLSKYPNESWLEIDGVSDDSIRADQLRDFPQDLSDAILFVWRKKGNLQMRIPVVAFDRPTGTLRLPTDKGIGLQKGDLFWLENSLDFLRNDGDWSIQEREGQFEITLRSVVPPNQLKMQYPGRASVVTMSSNSRLEGVTIEGSTRYGVESIGTTNVVVRQCHIRNHQNAGLWVRESNRVLIDHCNVSSCAYGVVVHSSKNVTIEKNDIGHNRVDGVRLCWGTRDTRVAENYIHHQISWSHPDAIQLFRSVEDIDITGNLLFTNGQSIMAEGCQSVRISDNAIIGSSGFSVIMGHGGF